MGGQGPHPPTYALLYWHCQISITRQHNGTGTVDAAVQSLQFIYEGLFHAMGWVKQEFGVRNCKHCPRRNKQRSRIIRY